MSLQSLLSIARSALLTHQRALDVTGHNIANANTPGYSRQRLELTAETPLYGALFSVGRGVLASALTRARDPFNDGTFREQSAALGLAGTLQDHLGRIEAVLHEPSDTGIASSLDGLFGSFSDLASDPTNSASRDQVRSAAQRLASQLNAADASLGRALQDAGDQMRSQVTQVNGLLRQISDLNGQIQATGGPEHIASDLMDQRDNLLDQLSQYGDVRVLDRGDGSVGVLFGGSLVVDPGLLQQLDVRAVGSGLGIGIAGGSPIQLAQGSLRGLADMTQTWLPQAKQQLDTLAGALVEQVNALHRTGFSLSGATGLDFFDPAGTTAGTIALSSTLLASSDNIAASDVVGPGGNGVALQLAALRDAPLATLGGRTLRDYHIALAGWVGTGVQDAGRDVDASSTLLDRADALRQSVSGVSVDEEMINLMSEQQAYSAAARLVTVADSMMQEILNMI